MKFLKENKKERKIIGIYFMNFLKLKFIEDILELKKIKKNDILLLKDKKNRKFIVTMIEDNQFDYFLSVLEKNIYEYSEIIEIKKLEKNSKIKISKKNEKLNKDKKNKFLGNENKDFKKDKKNEKLIIDKKNKDLGNENKDFKNDKKNENLKENEKENENKKEDEKNLKKVEIKHNLYRFDSNIKENIIILKINKDGFDNYIHSIEKEYLILEEKIIYLKNLYKLEKFKFHQISKNSEEEFFLSFCDIYFVDFKIKFLYCLEKEKKFYENWSKIFFVIDKNRFVTLERKNGIDGIVKANFKIGANHISKNKIVIFIDKNDIKKKNLKIDDNFINTDFTDHGEFYLDLQEIENLEISIKKELFLLNDLENQNYEGINKKENLYSEKNNLENIEKNDKDVFEKNNLDLMLVKEKLERKELILENEKKLLDEKDTNIKDNFEKYNLELKKENLANIIKNLKNEKKNLEIKINSNFLKITLKKLKDEKKIIKEKLDNINLYKNNSKIPKSLLYYIPKNDNSDLEFGKISQKKNFFFEIIFDKDKEENNFEIEFQDKNKKNIINFGKNNLSYNFYIKIKKTKFLKLNFYDEKIKFGFIFQNDILFLTVNSNTLSFIQIFKNQNFNLITKIFLKEKFTKNVIIKNIEFSNRFKINKNIYNFLKKPFKGKKYFFLNYKDKKCFTGKIVNKFVFSCSHSAFFNFIMKKKDFENDDCYNEFFIKSFLVCNDKKKKVLGDLQKQYCYFEKN